VTFVRPPVSPAPFPSLCRRRDEQHHLYHRTIQITVSGGSVNITYTTAQNTPKTFAPSDFYTPFYTAPGTPCTILFLFAAVLAYGTLYVGYTSASSPGTAAGTSTAYFYSGSPGISAVTFVPASGFSGTVSIPYVAVATNNTTYTTGTIQITVSGSGGSAYSPTSARPTAGRRRKLTTCTTESRQRNGNGLFSPANAITRGDFLLMLYRLMATGQFNRQFHGRPEEQLLL
jgi:hypothetical protein